MKNLKDIYNVLKAEGLVSTQIEFSQRWLGRSAHYMAQVGGDPEKTYITSLALLASELRHAATFAKKHLSDESFRRIHGAQVAAATMRNGVYEMRYMPPFYRVTAASDVWISKRPDAEE